ncbi:MAG: hypothetical protein ACK52I_34700 [Pseudomonadota bacterium]
MPRVWPDHAPPLTRVVGARSGRCRRRRTARKRGAFRCSPRRSRSVARGARSSSVSPRIRTPVAAPGIGVRLRAGEGWLAGREGAAGSLPMPGRLASATVGSVPGL